MLARRIIPCLDIDQGRVVKGVCFKNIRDAGDPVEVARRYNEEGADEIAVLDISASQHGRKTMLQTIRAIAAEVFIPLTVGGGVCEVEDVRALLRAGADKVSINTAAVLKPELIKCCAEVFGSQCIVAAIDARRSSAGSGWEVYTHGGRRAAGIDAVEWAQRLVDFGAGEILLTSMDRDGTREGFDLRLTAAISTRVSVPVIASGGVGNLKHLAEGFLEGAADAVLAASIFHFGEYTIGEAKEFLAAQNIAMRL